MKNLLIFLFTLVSFLSPGQLISVPDSLHPDQEYENIHVKMLASDSLQSTFVIWVKQSVKMHYHAEHTENIVVLEGTAEMTLGDSSFIIRKGDYINIPSMAPHSVNKVISEQPLKVLSIQSPGFDGSDRIFIEQKEKHENY